MVSQLGARRHYLVPATFHAAGMLEHFFTDLYLAGGLSRQLTDRLAQVVPLRAVRRLVGRQDTTLPAELVTAFPWFGLQYKQCARKAKRGGAPTSAWLWGGRVFAQAVADRGFLNANAVYAYSSAALETFEAARCQGVACILDHATAPKLIEDALVAEQDARYRGWSANPPQQDSYAAEYAQRQDEECELANVIVCGSAFVQRIVESTAGRAGKTVVVPLALRTRPSGVEPKQRRAGRPLRILFVGDEAIRKGIGDLWEAIRRWGPHRCEARVIGNIDLSDEGRRIAGATLELCGPIPRTEMPQQYHWADVLVLPSVSDTFGLVILEAMSYGVPVVTTPNTGAADVVEEGGNGFIVPIMDPDAIAACLERLHADRTLLESLSEQALRLVQNFEMDQYARGLVQAVRQATGSAGTAHGPAKPKLDSPHAYPVS